MFNVKNVETISRAIMSADSKADEGRTNYLRSLVAAVQGQLEKGAEKAAQLAALREVNESYYEAVMGVAETFVPKHTKDRATLVHAKANFARTAASALRRYISGGNDAMALKAETVTKGLLRARAGPTTPRQRSVRVLRGQVERRSKALMSAILGLADSDKDAATEELQLLIGQLTEQLQGLAPELVHRRPGRPAKSTDLHGQTMVTRGFNPSATTVQRAQARAA